MVFGCAHKQKTDNKPPEPSPSPKGDLLRFKANAGDTPTAKVTLLIEQESGGKSQRKLSLSFTLTEEEKVDAVSPDGTAQISSRLVDVVGKASAGATEDQINDFALALDELKIQFRRSPRGDVSSITLMGVRSPLDDKTARTILNAIFAGGRGPILPEEFIDVGGTWTNTAQVPTPFVTPAEATYTYKYAGRNGTVATITCDGALDSQKPGATPAPKRMIGKSTSEYKFDFSAGKLVALTSDGNTQIDENGATPGSGFKGRVQVTWAANQ
jgi:hypothetical protein